LGFTYKEIRHNVQKERNSQILRRPQDDSPSQYTVIPRPPRDLAVALSFKARLVFLRNGSAFASLHNVYTKAEQPDPSEASG
jgi:hypothetical protein